MARISPEAPIPYCAPTARGKTRQRGLRHGESARAGRRGQRGQRGRLDRNGQNAARNFRRSGIDTRAIITDSGRPTTVKSRMLGSVQAANRATQQLLRVDEEDRAACLRPRTELIERLDDGLERADGVLVSDINKGVLTPKMLRAIIDGGDSSRIPVISIRESPTILDLSRRDRDHPQTLRNRTATGIKMSDRDAWPVRPSCWWKNSSSGLASSRSIARGCTWLSAAARPTSRPRRAMFTM